MAQLKVTQIKSIISEKQYQRDTLRSLGLKRIGQTVLRPDNPVNRVMFAPLRTSSPLRK
jgi:large subunit ribosomal protein L30